MLTIIDVKKGELAVVNKRDEINTIVSAGRHTFWDPFSAITYYPVDLADTEIEPNIAEKLLNFYPQLVEKYCHIVNVADNEIALRYEENMLVEIIMPATKALYWQSYKAQLIKKVTLQQGYRLPDEIALELIQAKNTARLITGIDNIKLHYFVDEQIGTLFVDNQFVQIIPPKSVIGLCEFKHKLVLGKFKLQDNRIDDLLAATIEQNAPEQMQQYCVQMQVGANQAGLRFEDDLLVEILPPGTKRLYWQNNCKQHMQIIELAAGYQLSEQMVQQLLQPKLRQKEVIGDSSVLIAQVPAYHVGVLKVNGKVEQLLDAGITAYWRFNREISVEIVDTRLQTVEISGQEILTRDKVNLRINLVANWCYTDVLTAFAKAAQPVELLYRQLQFALREAIGTRTLDELLENKDVIDEVINAHMQANMTGYGIETISVGVKDIILPGDMKTILAQVVEAEKAAQANVIRRREETSATRSLLNTARVMENNPVALRLKEMETLERIAERIDKISVVGGLDQLLHGLINIQAK
ncbi:slipin family protein [Snodgrassella communis]|uniref:slipin family protein n=1 Tax=Snodgrassella communis TaxID=2946699 RepID=UPI001EF70346|nr:slipin family protein [Snodgrassella communis]